MASSFDCIGPIARNAEDAQIVFDAIEGLDSKDSTTVGYDFSNSNDETNAIYYEVGNILDEEISKHKFEGINIAQKEPVEKLGITNESLAAYYVLVPSEISSNLERYDGIRYGESSQKASNLSETYFKTRGEFFGPEVKRRNLIGSYALSAGYYDAYYKKAMQVRTIVKEKVDKVLEKYDVIIVPTTMEPAFKIGSKSDPIEMYKTDLLTVFVNLAGVPSVSIPFGIDEDTNLPLGLQIIGKQGDDLKILEIAKKIQSLTKYHEGVEGITL
jgi:aspartyl-tRNA(Asn)/glutamyl-tRNA(Gln) amidotransferase subunit A